MAGIQSLPVIGQFSKAGRKKHGFCPCLAAEQDQREQPRCEKEHAQRTGYSQAMIIPKQHDDEYGKQQYAEAKAEQREQGKKEHLR